MELTNPPAILPAAPRERISVRYATTLLTQSFQLIISVATAGIVPRALGPVDFGNYNFIYNMASTVRNFTDLGARHTFFTYSSKLSHSGTLTKLYTLWLGIQLTLSLLLITLGHLFHFQNWLWPQQMFWPILVVTTLEWLVGLAMTLQQLGDSKGRTIRTRVLMAGLSFTNAVGIVLLAYGEKLRLTTYIGWLYLTTLLTLGVMGQYLLVSNKSSCWDGQLRNHWVEHLRTWKSYATPLIVFGIYMAAYNFLDTYLIQRLYGAKEQAYLALSNRFSSIVLIFTTSALSIYWREIANALSTKDMTAATHIYLRFTRVLFSLTLVLSLWLSFNAGNIVQVWAGSAYHSAVPVLVIMAFYPLQQTFGQLSGSVFLASERTTQYRNYGILLSLPALVLTYVLLAPTHATLPGLNLGARGVAIKMVIYGLISVQAYDIANARYFHLSYATMLMEKLRVASILGITAFVTVFAGRALASLKWPDSAVALLLMNSSLYFGLLTLMFYRYPWLMGLTLEDRQRALGYLHRKLADARRRNT